MEGYQWGVGVSGKGTGNKKHNWQVQNKQGEVKSSTGNEEAKELTCTTHGHELSGEMLEGEGVQDREGQWDFYKWDNSNSIINKIYLKKEDIKCL